MNDTRTLRRRTERWATVGGLLLAAGYLVSGWTIVGPEEVAIVLRCGRLVGGAGPESIHTAGLLLAWPPPIDRVVRVPAKREESWTCRHFWQPPPTVLEANDTGELSVSPRSNSSRQGPDNLGLTGDLNFVSLEFTVKYQVTDPVSLLLHSAEPRAVLHSVVQGETQAILSQSTIDELLQLTVTNGNQSGGKASEPESMSLPELVRSRAADRLRELRVGISLTSVDVQAARPPAETQRAFESLQTARIEQETSRDRAVGLAAERVLEAETLAQQTIAEEHGKHLIRSAEMTELVRSYEADLRQVQLLGTEMAVERLRAAALREVLGRARQVLVAPELPPGSELRWHLATPEVKP